MKRLFIKLEFLIVLLLLVLSLLFDKAIVKGVLTFHHPYIVYLMAWVTHLGSVFVVMILMSSIFLYEESKREWIPVLWLSFLSAAIVSFIIKWIVARPRPVSVGFETLGSSFPSVHAAIAFATVPILDREFPMLKWFWIGFALLVGISRVYFQYHYLSDVLGGGLIGLAVGHFFVVEEQRLRFIAAIKRRLPWIHRSS